MHQTLRAPRASTGKEVSVWIQEQRRLNMKSTDYCNDLVSAFCFFPDFPSLPLLDLGRSAPSLSSLGSFFLGAGTGAGESSIKKSMMDCESFGLLRPPLVRFSLFSWLDR